MKEYAHELAEILKYNSFDVVHQNIRGSDYFINPIPDYETVLQRSHLLDCKNRIMVAWQESANSRDAQLFCGCA